MLQVLLEVEGVGMLFKSPAFIPMLGIHILAGLVCIVTGIVTMASEKRAGLHPICGTIYHWSLAVLVISAGFLAVAHCTEDGVLLALGVISFGASCLGRTARRRHWQSWVGTHIIFMGTSFIAMLTAFCLEEGKSSPGLSGLPRSTYWFLPALVGTPLIMRALFRYRFVPPCWLHCSRHRVVFETKISRLPAKGEAFLLTSPFIEQPISN